jgi:hypothetical protein
MVGAIVANFHEGSRSEYLAQFILASFGTAVAVPHHEDHGVDFFCTLTETVGQMAWAKASYTVQVKSDLKPWAFQSAESVAWLIKHPLPLFLGVIDKKTATLRIYHTAPRFCIWGLGYLPERLEMTPTEETVGVSTQWSEDHKFPLVPILAIDIVKLADDDYWRNARRILEFWIESENSNLTRIRVGQLSWKMPDSFETNALPKDGSTEQWLSMPSEELLNNGIRHLCEGLECMGSQFNGTGKFVAAVEAALLHRYLHQNSGAFPDEYYRAGKLSMLVNLLLNKLPAERRSYVYAGVDEIQKRLEIALKETFET